MEYCSPEIGQKSLKKPAGLEGLGWEGSWAAFLGSGGPRDCSAVEKAVVQYDDAVAAIYGKSRLRPDSIAF